jgi:hypothetical protein
MDGDQELV